MANMFSKDGLRNKIIVFVFLLLIFFLAFFIRAYFPYKTVFSEGVVKYPDDAMYHMRFLENMLLGGHFPQFIYFDPYTNFPHGTYSSPAPLYDFVLAVFIWLISFGKPTIEIINKVAPFYPSFLGSLIPIVVYFIAKALWNSPKISLVSAFFTAISVPILYKSLLGLNDHHIAEVLLSSLSLMFLFYALKYAKNGTSVKNRKLWLFVLLTGFSMGLYLLAWAGAILFLFLIFVFLTVYYLKEFISKNSAGWILSAGTIIFLLPFLMMLPFLGHPSINSGIYNIYHLLCFGLGFLGFFILWAFSFFIKKKSLNRWQIIFFLIIFSLLFLLFFKIIFPDVFDRLLILANGVNNNGLASAGFKSFISEMKPFKFQGAISDFSSLFFLYLLGFFITVYNFFKPSKPDGQGPPSPSGFGGQGKNPEYLLLIIWTIFTFLITGIIPFFGQMRFNIYIAINVVLFAGFVVVKGFKFGRESLNISSRLEKTSPIRTYFLTGSVLILFSLVFFIIYPFPFNAGLSSPQSLPDIVLSTTSAVTSPYGLSNDWTLLLKWLKEKTPDPGIGFYDLYPEPGINKETGKVNPYIYPEQAYGVLAQWDFGHAIVYYGHRPAVANPFQQGIGRKENGKVTEPGSAVFLLETDENKAISYLNQLKTRYVITESNLAILDTGSFNIMVKWIQGNMDGYLDEPEDSLTKYDNSMVARLHLLDGTEAIINKKVNGKTIDLAIKPLQYFRLLYESGTTSHIFSYKDSTKDVKAAKVFEYVRGAKIKGVATSGAEVIISTEVITNQGRKFIYQQKTIAKNDSFEFLVPYSTGKQENSDVIASDYTIKIGNYTKNIKVTEEDVLQGKTIKNNF